MPTLASSESEQLVQFSQGTPPACDIAFEALFHEHQGAVFAWILRIVRDPAAAEDITVETFWRIYRAHALLDPQRGFAGWARRIATHAALDWLRAHKVESTHSVELPEDLAAPPEQDPAICSEIRRKTANAFARLRPALRVAATLAVIEGLPHKEVAEALGISVPAVKLRVFRALRILRKELAKEGMTP